MRRNRMGVSVAAQGGCSLLVAAALFCAAAQAQTHVRVGNINTISDAALYIAEKKGYFAAEGLDVKLVPFDSAAKMTGPLGIGQLEAGSGSVSAGLYNAVGRGIKLRIVADKGSIRPGYSFSALMVRKDLVESGRYHDYKDLKGLRVAVGGRTTGNASGLNEALKKGGLTWRDIEPVELAFPQQIAAYKSKAIDAGMVNEPTLTRLLQAGLAVRIAGNDEFYPYQQTSVLLYSEDFATKQRDTAMKFMRAYIRAARFYNDALANGRLAGPNADEVIDILAEYTPVKDKSLYRVMWPNACDPDGKVNADGLRKDLAFFREQGFIESRDITVDRVLDPSFAEAVVRELGPYRPGAWH